MSTDPGIEAAIEFLSQVRTAAGNLRTKELRVWYRGLSSCKYTLHPSLLRKKDRFKNYLVGEGLRLKEKNLFARFQTQAGELLPKGGSWEILSAMQHYGVPTRMMDWTDSLFVALYFALEYEDKDEVEDYSPCIWLLNPFALNNRALALPQDERASKEEASKKAFIFDQVDRLPENAYKVFIEKKDAIEDKDAANWKAWVCKWRAWPLELPIATAPIWGHPRALRQHGFFTIHGTDTRPIEEQEKAKDLVEKVKIPDNLHEPLRQLLQEAGVDHYSLFPDLEGLARKLRHWYKWT
jgi:hypothetical protein